MKIIGVISSVLLMTAFSVLSQNSTRIINCGPVADGFLILWTPCGETVVQWSPDLKTPFSDLSGILPASYGSYTDTVHCSDDKCFYRLKILSSGSGGMVLIPGGTNSGTNPLGEGETYTEFYPETYSLTVNAFYMDRFEVTNDEMVEVMQWAHDNGKLTVSINSVQNAPGDPQELLDLDDSDCRIIWDGSAFGMKPDKGSGYPCVEVSWYGSAAYCNYKSEMNGLTPCYNLSDWTCNLFAGGYRLPTSDEWEYAARGGLKNKRFGWGDTISHSNANYSANGSAYSYDTSPYTTYTYHPDYNDGTSPYTSPCGSFAANGYGLYDMVGNVWERCADWLPSYEGTYRMIRGGSWKYRASYCRAGARDGIPPSNTAAGTGFRAVLPAD